MTVALHGFPAKWGVSPSAWRDSDDPDDFVLPELGYRLASLADGEGCFSISGAQCVFIVKMRLDDRPFLERVREELGGPGEIREGGHDSGTARRPWARWVVSRRREVIWLTTVFDRYPLWSKKARDYAIWRDAAIEWYAGTPVRELGEHKRRLAEAREYREAA